MRTALLRLLLGFLALLVLAVAVYFLPPVNERLAWRVDAVHARIKYALSPPEQVVFIPQEQQGELELIVQGTLQALTPTPTSSPTPIPSLTPTVPGPTETALPTPTLTPTPTPLPDKVKLVGIVHEYQGWNNCGPATLAMALTYWGWKGDQRDTAKVLKPVREDKNVMPYEMVSYVEEHAGLKAVVRVGGDLDLLKRFTAAGFPVLIEKGLVPPKDGWMGHYQLVAGYDEKEQRFHTYDAYAGSFKKPGDTYRVPYADMQNLWQDFNYIYLVIYPPEREAEVFSLLGLHADEAFNTQQAAEKASSEILELTGRDLYFAWYNRGTNLVALQDYAGAAAAYDEAFRLYAELPEKDRPWRNIWYQTGPYFAYFYTGRYYDVLDLATKTLQWLSTEPVLEESWVWKARAKIALGDTAGAISDLRTSLKYHPGFPPSLSELQRLGVPEE